VDDGERGRGTHLLGNESTSSFDQLYRSMQRDLVRLAVVLVDDVGLAEEIVQDAFAGLFQRWDQLADPAAAPGYVRRSVINAARSELRRRGSRRQRTWRLDREPTASAESIAMLGAAHRAVLSAVRELPRRQREVVLLRYWQGLSERQIAETLNISTGSVKSAASRGLDTVERQLRRSQ